MPLNSPNRRMFAWASLFISSLVWIWLTVIVLTLADAVGVHSAAGRAAWVFTVGPIILG